MSNINSTLRSRTRKRGLGLPLIIAGGVASLVLALSISPSFAAFSASITNTVNTAATGALVMTETSGSNTCTSTDISTGTTASCTTINKYGGQTAMIPGATATTELTIKNAGTVDASAFTLTPGTCTTTNNGTVNGTGNLCSKMMLKVTSGTTDIYEGTLAAFTAVDLKAKLGGTAILSGADVPFKFVVTLPSDADNTYAGRQVNQQLTWTFNA